MDFKKNMNAYLPEAKRLYNIAKKRITRVSHSRIQHLYCLRKLIGNKHVNYLEVGVLHGGSMIMVIAQPYITHCVGVDLFQENKNYIRKDLPCMARTKKFIRNFNIYGNKFNLIQGDSTSDSVVEKVKSTINNVDVLYIDGNHSFEFAYKDFYNYAPLINKDGFIAFDDIHFNGVRKLIRHIDHKLVNKGFLNKINISDKIGIYKANTYLPNL